MSPGIWLRATERGEPEARGEPGGVDLLQDTKQRDEETERETTKRPNVQTGMKRIDKETG